MQRVSEVTSNPHLNSQPSDFVVQGARQNKIEELPHVNTTYFHRQKQNLGWLSINIMTIKFYLAKSIKIC